MNTTQPIRDLHALQTFKNYYRDTECNFRNYTLIIMGLNTALRINDILHIKWGDVYDFDTLKLLDHIEIKEKKNRKTKPYCHKSAVKPYFIRVFNIFTNRKFTYQKQLPVSQQKRQKFSAQPLPGIPYYKKGCHFCRISRKCKLSFTA